MSIVIPAWNEEDRLALTLEEYIPSLEAWSDPFALAALLGDFGHRGDGVANRQVRVGRLPTTHG